MWQHSYIPNPMTDGPWLEREKESVDHCLGADPADQLDPFNAVTLLARAPLDLEIRLEVLKLLSCERESGEWGGTPLKSSNIQGSGMESRSEEEPEKHLLEADLKGTLPGSPCH